MKRFLLAIGAGVLLATILFLIGALYSGGGHSLTAITVFFPYSGLVAPSLKDTRWEIIAMILMVAQFPVYALLVVYTKGLRRNIVLTIISILHTVAAVIALQVYESSQPRYGLLLPVVAIQALEADALECWLSWDAGLQVEWIRAPLKRSGSVAS